ncbi:MAG: ribonuclease P protein component [Patescibacteria group bacterium]
MAIKWRENALGHNRFAVIVGNGVEKKSVRRHFWKRRVLRAASQWPNAGRDFLFIASRSLRETSAAELSHTLNGTGRELAAVSTQRP